MNSIDEDDESSVSSSDGEEESDEHNISEENEAQTITSVANKSNRVKKSKGGKRSNKEQLFQKMHGKAPSISLSLPSSLPNDTTKIASSKQQQALQIPTILLPPNYIRDNPNWDTASAAKSLLATWDNLNSSAANIIVVLLQSGRFVAAVYTLKTTTHSKVPQLTMIAHKTSTRYTIRKGQGGSQSNYDSSKNKANSIGAQLRREGEKQLREDVVATWKLWRESNYIQCAMRSESVV